MGRRTILVVGAGRWQTPLIERVRALGHRCVATDRDPGAPGQGAADAFFAVGMHDEEGLLRVATEQRVDAVLTDQSDRAVAVVARLSEQLDTPGIGPSTARRFTDKEAMRRALEGVVMMPSWCVAKSATVARRAAERWSCPVVLKPPDNQASVGVSLAGSPSEVDAAFESAAAISRDGRVLVEEFIGGPELTVESFSSGGRCAALGISHKAHYERLPCVAKSLAWPPRLPPETLAAVRGAAVRAVEALGLPWGLGHSEFRLRDGVPYLVEVAARGGGSGIASTIVPHISGFDPTSALVRAALGEPTAVPRPAGLAAVLGFFDFGTKRVASVRGRRQVLAEGLADVFELDLQPGDHFGDPTSDIDRPGRFIVLGQTREEVDARARRIRELVRVEVTRTARTAGGES